MGLLWQEMDRLQDGAADALALISWLLVASLCRCMALPFYLGAWLAVDM